MSDQIFWSGGRFIIFWGHFGADVKPRDKNSILHEIPVEKYFSRAEQKFLAGRTSPTPARRGSRRGSRAGLTKVRP